MKIEKIIRKSHVKTGVQDTVCSFKLINNVLAIILLDYLHHLQNISFICYKYLNCLFLNKTEKSCFCIIRFVQRLSNNSMEN